jgi:hypothetical protein
MHISFSVIAMIAAGTVAGGTPSALASETTAANGAKWSEVCANGKIACSVLPSPSEQTLYKACADGKCYQVTCKSAEPEAACVKSELPGAHPQPKRMQSSIFGLL